MTLDWVYIIIVMPLFAVFILNSNIHVEHPALIIHVEPPPHILKKENTINTSLY